MSEPDALDAEAAILAVVESADFTKLAAIPFKDAMAAWDRLHATEDKPDETEA
jgi:hypothetical protein